MVAGRCPFPVDRSPPYLDLKNVKASKVLISIALFAFRTQPIKRDLDHIAASGYTVLSKSHNVNDYITIKMQTFNMFPCQETGLC